MLITTPGTVRGSDVTRELCMPLTKGSGVKLPSSNDGSLLQDHGRMASQENARRQLPIPDTTQMHSGFRPLYSIILTQQHQKKRLGTRPYRLDFRGVSSIRTIMKVWCRWWG